LIKNAAAQAIRRVAERSVPLPGIRRPATLELDLGTADLAEVATWVGGVDRSGQRQVTIAGADLLSIFTRFVAVSYITRQAGGR
jgi:D-amino peptidase